MNKYEHVHPGKTKKTSPGTKFVEAGASGVPKKVYLIGAKNNRRNNLFMYSSNIYYLFGDISLALMYAKNWEGSSATSD